MRRFLIVCVFFTAGCGGEAPRESPTPEKTLLPAGYGREVSPESSTPVRTVLPASGGNDWPCFLGPTGDSVSTEKGIVSPWPKEGLRLIWQTSIGHGYPGPVVSAGKLYVFDRDGDNARLRCIKSTTGALFWKFTYPTAYEDQYGYENGPRCSPLVDGDRVYIYGSEGMLHCLNTADGKLIWKVDTAKKFGVQQNFFGVGSCPVVEGDLLIVQVGGSTEGSEGKDIVDLKPNGTGVVAFDKKTGAIKYQIGDELASYATPVLATIGDRRWCFVLARGGLLGFDPTNGKIDFHYPWRSRGRESVNASNPVVVGNRVFITECYGPGGALLEVKPGGYKAIWTDALKERARSMACHWMTPIYHDGYLYGSSGRHTSDATLRCIELATGKVMWSQRGMGRCSLLMVDGHFICLGEYGELRLLKVNPTKYEEVSQLMLKAPENPRRPLLEHPSWAAPVLSHGLLYVRGKGRLVCFELIPQKR